MKQADIYIYIYIYTLIYPFTGSATNHCPENGLIHFANNGMPQCPYNLTSTHNSSLLCKWVLTHSYWALEKNTNSGKRNISYFVTIFILSMQCLNEILYIFILHCSNAKIRNDQQGNFTNHSSPMKKTARQSTNHCEIGPGIHVLHTLIQCPLIEPWINGHHGAWQSKT